MYCWALKIFELDFLSLDKMRWVDGKQRKSVSHGGYGSCHLFLLEWRAFIRCFSHISQGEFLVFSIHSAPFHSGIQFSAAKVQCALKKIGGSSCKNRVQRSLSWFQSAQFWGFVLLSVCLHSQRMKLGWNWMQVKVFDQKKFQMFEICLDLKKK